MAKSKSPTKARKSRKSSADDRPVSAAERNQAIKFLQKHGGAHVPRPINGLIQDTPANTIDRCRQLVNWLAHIERPFSGDELDAAEADVLHFVVDALDHAEKVVRSVGSLADGEAAHG
jgi:hypothetical protein